jgi:heterodisulfide reductase subunit B
MKYALFRCCTTTLRLKQYETSTNAVLEALGIRFRDIKEFNCCGYPLKNFNYKAYLLASARNLSLAEDRGTDIMTVCNCCYGSLRYAAKTLSENDVLRDELNGLLAKEGLRYTGRVKVVHLLQLLYDDIGPEALRRKMVKRFKGLRIATHYGCHILRPSNVTEFDSPFVPTKFDELVDLTGACSVSWSKQTECCGSPALGVNDDLSMDLAQRKLKDVSKAGAHALCVACPYCQLQFDSVQSMIAKRRERSFELPSILYPQLLGLCLGIDKKSLGLDAHQIPLDSVERFLEADVSREEGDEQDPPSFAFCPKTAARAESTAEGGVSRDI